MLIVTHTDLADPVDLASRLHRDTPPLLDPQRPDSPSFWLATCQNRSDPDV